MKIAIIMRGIPGSGKSTVARAITFGAGASIHSTDDYFYVLCKYNFDPKLLMEYHELNFQAFCQSLKEEVPMVVCDNTNVLHKYYERYKKAAEDAGYLVAIITMPHPTVEVAVSRNRHGVSADTIKRMIDCWEP